VTTLTLTPLLPVPNKPVSILFTPSEASADFLRVWCTVAPTGSALDKRINSITDPRNRVNVFEGAPSTPWTANFDKGGCYTFLIQEYRKGSGYGGGYEGDPNNSENEEKLGSEQSVDVFVGQRVTMPVGPAANQATLVMWVWDSHIRATSKAFHGEDSPAIIAESPNPIVKTAVETSAVKTAVATLVDADLIAGTTIGDLTTRTQNLWSAFNAHCASVAGAHVNADTYNPLKTSFKVTSTQKAFIEFVNAAIVAFRRHMTNDTGQPSADDPPVIGPDSGEFHVSQKSDRANLPLFDSVSTFGEAYSAFADLRRCYVAHEADLDVHDNAFSVVLTDPPLLTTVHTAYLNVIAAATPTTPPAQSDGVQALISRAGCKEA